MVKHWLSGAVAGSLHAVSGPDHLACLLPLCLNQGVSATWKGLLWGLGHGLGCSVMGIIGFICKGQLSYIEHIIEEFVEFILGFSLIAIGLIGIRRNRQFKNEQILPRYEDNVQMNHKKKKQCCCHCHCCHCCHSFSSKFIQIFHKIKTFFRVLFSKFKFKENGSVLMTGVFHGLSGTGHILGVIPALGYRDWKYGALYLAAFCVGTTFAMAMFTFGVGYVGTRIAERSQSNRVTATLSLIASCFALALGVFWVLFPLLSFLFF